MKTQLVIGYVLSVRQMVLWESFYGIIFSFLNQDRGILIAAV